MENRQTELSKPQKLLGAILILFLLIGGAFWLTKFIPFAEIFYTLKNENSKLNKEVIKLQADFDSMKKAKEEAENKVETCRNDPNFINQTMSNLREPIEASQAIARVKESFQKDLDSANKKIAELEKNCKPDCKAQVDKAIAKLNKELQAMKQAKKDTESRAASLEKQLTNEKESVKRLTVDLNNYRKRPHPSPQPQPTPKPVPDNCERLKLKIDTGTATRQEQLSYWEKCKK